MIGISAGNHAQALAYCAALEGIDALARHVAGRERAEDRGDARATARRSTSRPTGPAEAFERLDELIEETGRALVHPFDDPLTIAGQGTVGLEIVEDVPEAAVVVVPVGGGGLISGIASVAARAAARVVGVEPELSRRAAPRARGRASRCRSSRGRSPTGSARPSPASTPSGSAASVGVESVLVTEEEIADGMRFLYGRAKLACEPAGAAASAALLAGKVAVEPG